MERGKARKVSARALARPESSPCQYGECAASACRSGRCARRRLQTGIAVSGSGIPTWTCSAAGRRARDQPAHLVADRLVALVLDVHDVAERRVRVQAAADERRALLAQQLALRGQVLDAFGRAAHDRRRGLDQRLVEVVHDRAVLGLDARRRDRSRCSRGRKRALVDEQELLLDAQRKVRRFAEVVLHARQSTAAAANIVQADVSKRHFDRGTAPPRADHRRGHAHARAPRRSTTSTPSARSCGPRASPRSASWSPASPVNGRRRPSAA